MAQSDDVDLGREGKPETDQSDDEVLVSLLKKLDLLILIAGQAVQDGAMTSGHTTLVQAFWNARSELQKAGYPYDKLKRWYLSPLYRKRILSLLDAIEKWHASNAPSLATTPAQEDTPQ